MMKIQQATMAELDLIVEILRDGRSQLAERGVDQWQGDYPNVEHVRADIANGVAYLIQAEDYQTVGALSIVGAPDHFYDQLDGQWLLATENYVVIHRLAIHSQHAGKGYASQLFVSLLEYLADRHPQIQSIRLSTNENNRAMQRVAEKNGFKKVGMLHGAFRPTELSYVYERLLQVPAALEI